MSLLEVQRIEEVITKENGTPPKSVPQPAEIIKPPTEDPPIHARYLDTFLDFLIKRPKGFYQEKKIKPERYLPPEQFIIITIGLFGSLAALSASLSQEVKLIYPMFVFWQAGIFALTLLLTLLEWAAFRTRFVRSQATFREYLNGKFYWSTVWILTSAIYLLVPLFFATVSEKPQDEMNEFVRIFSIPLKASVALLGAWYYIATLMAVSDVSKSKHITGFVLCEGLSVVLLSMLIMSPRQENTVVISQVYGGGGNRNAGYEHDFVELFNPTDKTVTVNGWSIQYAPKDNDLWWVFPLKGSIAPGGYYLVQQPVKDGAVANQPAPDALLERDLNAIAGKVVLANNTVPLKGACPKSSSIVDQIGYGGADCSEGTSAPALSNTAAAHRLFNGCKDSNDNAADFIADSPNPRNSNSPTQVCTDRH